MPCGQHYFIDLTDARSKLRAWQLAVTEKPNENHRIALATPRRLVQDSRVAILRCVLRVSADSHAI